MDDSAPAAHRFVLGESNDADLSMAVAGALARELDSPALVELACLDGLRRGSRTLPYRDGRAGTGGRMWSKGRYRRNSISAAAFGAASHSRTLLRTSVTCLHSQ